MKTRLAILAIACMGGLAAASMTPVWSIDGGNGTAIHPYGKWFTYADSATASADEVASTDGKKFIFSITKDESSYAGAGFAWAANGKAVDLSAYEGQGLCLTYTSLAPFRVDFKQTNISNSNYNGVVVPAQSKMETAFFPFEDFAQEDWGQTTKIALDLSKQTGVQVSFKPAHSTTRTTNTVVISAIAFGTSCVNNPPSLKTGVTSPAEETLDEGDTLRVELKNIFEDEDGDALNIVATVEGYAEDASGAKSYGLGDVVKLVSKPNPKGANTSATATFTAKDPQGASVKYVINLTLVDQDNAPTAVADFHEVDEDDTLTVGITKGVIANDSDADGDEFSITDHTDPLHGKLIKFSTLTGGFTYVPDADFFGEDTFTYTIADTTGKKAVGVVTITVKNVDDPATVVVNEPTFYVEDISDENARSFEDGLVVKEDFQPVTLIVPTANVVFTDPDEGESVTPNAKSKKGLFEVEIGKSGQNYVMTLSSVADANGADTIVIYVGAGKTLVSVEIPVTITNVQDDPKAVSDTFTVGQGEKTEISAAKGVLVNDINPDGKTTLKAYLAEDATEGTVKLATDGSFTYEVGDYEGSDGFVYFVVNAAGDTSKPAIVYLNVVYKNKAPVVLAGVADTVGNRLAALKEDFSGKIEYRAAEVVGWFTDPEKDKITYSISNTDSLVSATINSSAVITVRAVKNACGEGSFSVVATDANKNSSSLKIPVSVSCVNDAPVRIGGAVDSIFEQPRGWREAFHVTDLFEDVDDSILTLKISVQDKENVIAAEVVGDSLIVNLVDEARYMQSHVPYTIKVVATDEAGATAIAKTLIFITDPNKVAIPQLATASKLGWQGAIRADRGMAAIFDMQGRVMWKAKLPVSEADVRNAAAQVQGRKVLRVNKQTWTIK